MASGKLCVSVIEARNVQADDYAEKNFYVRLRIGSNEIKTDIIKGTLQPKFLKDCRLTIATPETDVLRIELMQVGPRGDLVVGSDELRVISITAKGTIVHWFELKTSSRMLGAELCLVLRYLSAGTNRPMSPSYAIAARQAKERALDGDGQPAMGPSKALFQDAPATPTRSAANSNVIAQPGSPYASPSGHAAAPSPLSPGGMYQPQTPASTSSAQAPLQRKPSMVRRVLSMRLPSLGLVAVPLPVAVLCGALVGAVAYSLQRRPVFYEVLEDDTLCHIAACFEKTTKGRRLAKDSVLRSPDIIYPGDRIRVR